MATNDDLQKIGYEVKNLLKLLLILVFVSLAVMSTSTVLTRRAAENASASSKDNSRTLELVEQCVVKGDCGPGSGDTTKLINYIVDSVTCVLLVEPSERTETTIQDCKTKAISK